MVHARFRSLAFVSWHFIGDLLPFIFLCLLSLFSDLSSFVPLSISQLTDVVNECMEVANVLELSACQIGLYVDVLCLVHRPLFSCRMARRRRKPLSIQDFGAGGDFARRAAENAPGKKYFLSFGGSAKVSRAAPLATCWLDLGDTVRIAGSSS
jgi:hypothetical protein